MPVHFDGSILALQKSKAWLHMTAGDIGLVHPSLTLQHLILVALLSLSQHRCPYRHIGVMPPVVVHFDSNITCRVWKSRLFPFRLITFLRQSFLILSSLLYIWKPTEVVNSDSSITILRHCSWEAQCTSSSSHDKHLWALHHPHFPLLKEIILFRFLSTSNLKANSKHFTAQLRLHHLRLLVKRIFKSNQDFLHPHLEETHSPFLRLHYPSVIRKHLKVRLFEDCKLQILKENLSIFIFYWKYSKVYCTCIISAFYSNHIKVHISNSSSMNSIWKHLLAQLGPHHLRSLSMASCSPIV